QGINWNNYSANQIVELKNKGMEVPDDVYDKAQAQISETDANEVKADSKDDAKVSYTIQDRSGEKNEAKELRAQLEAEGESLKSMVKQFTDKSVEATETLSKTMESVDQLVSYITENEDAAVALGNAADDESAVVMQIVADANEEIQQKEDELDFLNEKIEDGTATESEQNEAQTLSDEIGEISDETSTEIGSKVATAQSMNSQVATINDNLKDVANQTGKAINNAKDAMELADETKDLSKKLYDKGAKKQKIAMALGAAVGGVGGFFAGKAISNKINSNMFESKGITKTSTSEYDMYSSTTASISDINSAIKSEKTTNMIGKGGGIVAGAGIGLALGSLFGKSEMNTGSEGIAAANKLNDVAKQTQNIAETVAEQNGISIASVNTADTQVADFNAEVSDGNKTIDDETKSVNVAETPDTPVTTETDDEEAKKKQPVA
ncbi:hypothetical protein IJ707_06900, partial [bacterium]|nr:hypothetical protein [bacterium]